MTFQTTTLHSGLRVATEHLPSMESVALMVSCGVGARHELESEGGISHMLEHMAFKGTPTRNAREIAEAFDTIGGQTNAYTSMEYTVYYARVLKQDMPLAMEILGDILCNSTFDEQELVREKGVILQEIAMHRDTPDDLIMDYFDAVAYPNQPMGRSILSTEERVSSHSRAAIMGYMQRHYQPGRMVVSAAGAIDHAQLVPLVEQHLPLAATHESTLPQKGAYQGGESRVARDLEQLHLVMGLPAFSNHHPDYYALQLLSSIFGGGMSSRLFQEVREKRGLAYTVYSSVSAYSDSGMLNLYAAAAPEQAQELSLVLCDELAKLTQGVSEKELRRAKNQSKAELLMARESPQAVAGWIGRHLLAYGQYIPASVLTARIEAVTLDDIRRVAQTVLSGHPTIAALGDVKGVPDYGKIQERLSA